MIETKGKSHDDLTSEVREPVPGKGKTFQKISFQLTPQQLETLAPFVEKVSAGMFLPDKDTRYAVMGNVWLSPADSREGTVDVYLIPAKQYHIINNAIVEAKKLK